MKRRVSKITSNLLIRTSTVKKKERKRKGNELPNFFYQARAGVIRKWIKRKPLRFSWREEIFFGAGRAEEEGIFLAPTQAKRGKGTFLMIRLSWSGGVGRTSPSHLKRRRGSHYPPREGAVQRYKDEGNKYLEAHHRRGKRPAGGGRALEGGRREEKSPIPNPPPSPEGGKSREGKKSYSILQNGRGKGRRTFISLTIITLTMGEEKVMHLIPIKREEGRISLTLLTRREEAYSNSSNKEKEKGLFP